MLKLAVVGKDVSKSESGKMHSFILRGMGIDCEYEHISVPPERFDETARVLLQEKNGFNVTIPYKLSVIPHLAGLDGDAAVFGAVNTVQNGVGYNTDGAGFMLSLENGGVRAAERKVLVLGAGGAGRSVIKKLKDGGAFVSVYDRNVSSAENVSREFGVDLLSEPTVEERYLIVNATGVGMHKTEGISPVGAEVLRRAEIAYDLIYCPRRSEFLRLAEGLGKKILNGEGMLFYQAYYADCIYSGRAACAEEAKNLFERYKAAEEGK